MMSKVLSFLSAHKRAIKVLILLCVVGYLLNSLYYFLQINGCMDDGLVWDYDEHRCRDDCLTFVKWIKNYLSCVKNTKELGIWTIRPATFISAWKNAAILKATGNIQLPAITLKNKNYIKFVLTSTLWV